jgi:hypothetical protein
MMLPRFHFVDLQYAMVLGGALRNGLSLMSRFLV